MFKGSLKDTVREGWLSLSQEASRYWEVYRDQSWTEYPYGKPVTTIIFFGTMGKILLVLYRKLSSFTKKGEDDHGLTRDALVEDDDSVRKDESQVLKKDRELPIPDNEEEDELEDYQETSVKDDVYDELIFLYEKKDERKLILKNMISLKLDTNNEDDKVMGDSQLQYQTILLMQIILNYCKDLIDGQDKPRVPNFHWDADGLLSPGKVREGKPVDYKKVNVNLRGGKGDFMFSLKPKIIDNINVGVLEIRDDGWKSKESIDLTESQLNHIMNVSRLLIISDKNSKDANNYRLKSLIENIQGSIDRARERIRVSDPDADPEDNPNDDESGILSLGDNKDREKKELSPLYEEEEQSPSFKQNRFDSLRSNDNDSRTDSLRTDDSDVSMPSGGSTVLMHDSQSTSPSNHQPDLPPTLRPVSVSGSTSNDPNTVSTNDDASNQMM